MNADIIAATRALATSHDNKCDNPTVIMLGKEVVLNAAADRIDELQRAFALACRIIGDNFPVCLPDNQSWQDHILERVRTEPVCRVCGCTEDNACTSGCYWVEPDLCSACAFEKGDIDESGDPSAAK